MLLDASLGEITDRVLEHAPMQKPASFLGSISALSAVCFLVVGCAAQAEEEETETTESALVTLTRQQCQTPVIHTAPLNDTSGDPVYGTAHTTLNGCIVRPIGAPATVTGATMLSRAQTVIGNTASFGQIEDSEGEPVFSQFTPHAASGTSQLIDVTLAVDNSPYGRVRVVRRVLADGRYRLTITNATAFKANALGFWPVTVIQPGKLIVDVIIRPEANGVVVTGTGDITLEVAKDKAAASAQLVRDVFEWLRGELD